MKMRKIKNQEHPFRDPRRFDTLNIAYSKMLSSEFLVKFVKPCLPEFFTGLANSFNNFLLTQKMYLIEDRVSSCKSWWRNFVDEKGGVG